MPKLKPKTATKTLDRTTQHRAAKRPRRNAPTCPQFARIEQAFRDAADAAFDLAQEKATPSERPCIRRVRRAFIAHKRAVPEFEDLAVTAEVLIRAFEGQLGPIDPRVGQMLHLELARFAHSLPRSFVASSRRHGRPSGSTAFPRHPFDVADVVYRLA